jgi:hypothetical protein
MLKRMALPAALMISTLGFTLVPSAAAADRDDYGNRGYVNHFDNNFDRDSHNFQESREFRERQERERRARELREHEQRERGYGDRDSYRR